jgi:hypothetical protein
MGMALRQLALASVLALTAACSSSDETSVSSFSGIEQGGASASGGSTGSGGGASGSDAAPGTGGAATDASGEAAADATIDAASAVDATSDVAVTGDADAASCDIGCTAFSPSGWCTAPTVEWVCGGAAYSYQRMLDAGCQDLATGAIRYCCPATFLPSCI